MKKFSKVLLSICMAFVVAFSLVGCFDGDDDTDPSDNGGSGGTTGGSQSTYTPPTGVDMTSMSEYVLWLIDNVDTTQSYEATIVSQEGIDITHSQLKYEYRSEMGLSGGLVVKYESGVLKDALQIVKSGTSYAVSLIDVESKTYMTRIETKLEAVKRRANIYCAYGIMLIPYQIELNSGYEIGTDITTIPGYDNSVTVTDTVTNPSNGKYVLTRTMSNGSMTMIYKLTVLNNRIINYSYEGPGASINISYEYKSVTINENFNDYEEVE